MFNWEFKEIINTNASAEQIWQAWADVEKWNKWDKELKWAKLNGEFAPASTGTMQPASGPKVQFTLSLVEKNSRFISCAKLPLGSIEFDHQFVKEHEGESKIIHSVKISGWLTPFFALVIGSKIKETLHKTMRELDSYAQGQ